MEAIRFGTNDAPGSISERRARTMADCTVQTAIRAGVETPDVLPDGLRRWMKDVQTHPINNCL